MCPWHDEISQNCIINMWYYSGGMFKNARRLYYMDICTCLNQAAVWCAGGGGTHSLYLKGNYTIFPHEGAFTGLLNHFLWMMTFYMCYWTTSIWYQVCVNEWMDLLQTKRENNMKRSLFRLFRQDIIHDYYGWLNCTSSFFYCYWKNSKIMMTWQQTCFVTCREKALWSRPL